jgi:hypothetical protein
MKISNSVNKLADGNLVFARDLKGTLLDLESQINAKFAEIENRIDLLESVVQP